MEERRRDEGTVLMLVLVLVIVGALITLPLLDYTIAVFRQNSVVSNRTKQSEAAKGGLRVALGDPKNVFLVCDNGGNLTPSPNPPINGISVQTTCSEIEEIGPAEALGYAVPKGAVTIQLGATVPTSLSGDMAESPAVPPYPATPDWWASPAPPDPLAQFSFEAEPDKIWMPDLPQRPPTTRTSTAFDMPAGYNCKVFFPGYYPNALTVPDGLVYFASGVYYFEEPVTISDDSDVVVGYGLEDFVPASDCADDLQVAANVLSPPTTFDINGGGATWVFGKNGQLVVDNTAWTTGARVRFNQRYSVADRGSRVSIITVNGDGPDDTSAVDHDVTNVNHIPVSYVLDDTTQMPLAGSGYVPSTETYTDKARLPEAPADRSATELQEAGVAPDRGALLLSWDEVAGQAAGGALLGEQDAGGAWITPPYEVQLRVQPSGPWIDVCPPEEQVIAPKTIPTDGNIVSCTVRGLLVGTQYRFRVRSVNEVGTSSWVGRNATPSSSSPIVAPPSEPLNVTALDDGIDDVAQISWDEPATNGGAPVTGYQADAYQVEIVPHPNVAPVAPPLFAEYVQLELPTVVDTSEIAQVRAFDPNGDDLTLTIDTSALPAEITAVANDLDDTITITATVGAVAGLYQIPYTVTDPAGESATGSMGIDVLPLALLTTHAPDADQLDLLADVGVPITSRAPVSDVDGMPLAAVPLTVDTTALDPADWTVSVSGIEVTITTTAPDGTYSIPYTVTGSGGTPTSNVIEVTVQRQYTLAGTCTVTTDPGYVTPTACEMSLPDLVPGTPTLGNQGYRFDVVATNAIGSSLPGTTAEPYPFGFDGTGVGLLPVPERIVVPWIPEPVLDVSVSGSAPVELAIAGYVAAPMGRVAVDNPNGHDVKINGGVMAGTIALDDSRATGAPGSVPIGFKNDIVLQRKVRIVSVAKNVTSTAIVQVNEDGAGYAVNDWVVG